MLDSKRAIDIVEEVKRLKKLCVNPLEILDSQYGEVEQLLINALKDKKGSYESKTIRDFVLSYRRRMRHG
ncbi:MAG: hypothetical protein ACUVQY_09130 [Thermoproteota archaeon]